MRIDRTRPSSNIRSSKKASPPAGDRAAFSTSLSGPAPAAGNQSASASVGVSSVAALMALQGAEDPLEKRRRSERRGRQMLEALDALKLDVLSERDPVPALKRMASALDSARENCGDQELEAVIDQIELRVAVEVAKYKRSHSF